MGLTKLTGLRNLCVHLFWLTVNNSKAFLPRYVVSDAEQTFDAVNALTSQLIFSTPIAELEDFEDFCYFKYVAEMNFKTEFSNTVLDPHCKLWAQVYSFSILVSS